MRHSLATRLVLVAQLTAAAVAAPVAASGEGAWHLSLRFGADGRISEHRDYFDFVGPTFAPVPVVVESMTPSLLLSSSILTWVSLR